MLIVLRISPRRASRGVGAAGERAYSRTRLERQGNQAGYGSPPPHLNKGFGGGQLPCATNLASNAATRALSASFSSRASRAISLTASNSSRCTTSSSRKMRSAWVRITVSNSRRTPVATPAASFINRATSSKKRLLVWVMGSLRAADGDENGG